jgi:hypothetical protein
MVPHQIYPTTLDERGALVEGAVELASGTFP